MFPDGGCVCQAMNNPPGHCIPGWWEGSEGTFRYDEREDGVWFFMLPYEDRKLDDMVPGGEFDRKIRVMVDKETNRECAFIAKPFDLAGKDIRPSCQFFFRENRMRVAMMSHYDGPMGARRRYNDHIYFEYTKGDKLLAINYERFHPNTDAKGLVMMREPTDFHAADPYGSDGICGYYQLQGQNLVLMATEEAKEAWDRQRLKDETPFEAYKTQVKPLLTLCEKARPDLPSLFFVPIKNLPRDEQFLPTVTSGGTWHDDCTLSLYDYHNKFWPNKNNKSEKLDEHTTVHLSKDGTTVYAINFDKYNERYGSWEDRHPVEDSSGEDENDDDGTYPDPRAEHTTESY